MSWVLVLEIATAFGDPRAALGAEKSMGQGMLENDGAYRGLLHVHVEASLASPMHRNVCAFGSLELSCCSFGSKQTDFETLFAALWP